MQNQETIKTGNIVNEVGTQLNQFQINLIQSGIQFNQDILRNVMSSLTPKKDEDAAEIKRRGALAIEIKKLFDESFSEIEDGLTGSGAATNPNLSDKINAFTDKISTEYEKNITPEDPAEKEIERYHKLSKRANIVQIIIKNQLEELSKGSSNQKTIEISKICVRVFKILDILTSEVSQTLEDKNLSIIAGLKLAIKENYTEYSNALIESEDDLNKLVKISDRLRTDPENAISPLFRLLEKLSIPFLKIAVNIDQRIADNFNNSFAILSKKYAESQNTESQNGLPEGVTKIDDYTLYTESLSYLQMDAQEEREGFENGITIQFNGGFINYIILPDNVERHQIMTNESASINYKLNGKAYEPERLTLDEVKGLGLLPIIDENGLKVGSIRPKNKMGAVNSKYGTKQTGMENVEARGNVTYTVRQTINKN